MVVPNALHSISEEGLFLFFSSRKSSCNSFLSQTITFKDLTYFKYSIGGESFEQYLIMPFNCTAPVCKVNLSLLKKFLPEAQNTVKCILCTGPHLVPHL